MSLGDSPVSEQFDFISRGVGVLKESKGRDMYMAFSVVYKS